jgi:hypothetical protein
MTATLFVLFLAIVPAQAEKDVSAEEKRTFLELLAKLPADGEFLTEESVEKAVAHTRVLLALTRKDIGNSDIYPFLALSRGLLERREQREYGVKHFGKIAHPDIKLFWGAVLFNENSKSPEIVMFLQTALDSIEQSQLLSRMLGPNFENFKKRVREQNVTGQ